MGVFCFKKLEVIQWIMLFLETSKFFSTPWDFDFEIFHEFLKMRRWRWYTWVFHQCILKITHHFHFPGNKLEFIIILNDFWSLTVTIPFGSGLPKGKNFTCNVLIYFHAFPFLVCFWKPMGSGQGLNLTRSKFQILQLHFRLGSGFKKSC